MVKEFQEFINKGNVIEMAVAFVMGLAFKPVIDAIVNRVLMPIIGLVFGQPNFDALGTFACEEGDAALADGLINGCAGSVGAVITAVVNFLLIALALFFVVRSYNRMKARFEAEEEAAAAEPEADPDEVVLLREIRDALTRP